MSTEDPEAVSKHRPELPVRSALPVNRLVQDALTRQQVLLAPLRAARPRSAEPGACPFCAAQAGDVDGTVLSSADSGDDWAVLLLDNPFPVVAGARNGPAAVLGIHQIFVEGSIHDSDFRNFPPDRRQAVVKAWSRRVAELAEEGGWAAIHVVKNSGAAAGATMRHPHSQLVGIHKGQELGKAPDFDACAMQIRRDGRHHSASRSGGLLSYRPESNRDSEVRVVPLGPDLDLARLSEEGAAILGKALSYATSAVTGSVGSSAYNLILSVWFEGGWSSAHWMARVIARSTPANGIEMALGLPVR